MTNASVSVTSHCIGLSDHEWMALERGPTPGKTFSFHYLVCVCVSGGGLVNQSYLLEAVLTLKLETPH